MTQASKLSWQDITPEEEAVIQAGINADPDSPELDERFFSHARRLGRPPEAVTKQALSLRVDRDVVERFKADGPGWQSRMNAALRQAVGL